MPGEKTATSPQRPGKARGVTRLLVLYPPASARAGGSGVLERALLLSREDGGIPEPGHTEGETERLVLKDREVSRRHAIIRPAREKAARKGQEGRDNAEWLLKDLGSYNGSFVNGERQDRKQVYRWCDKLGVEIRRRE